jgi:hypothetical protein
MIFAVLWYVYLNYQHLHLGHQYDLQRIALAVLMRSRKKCLNRWIRPYLPHLCQMTMMIPSTQQLPTTASPRKKSRFRGKACCSGKEAFFFWNYTIFQYYVTLIDVDSSENLTNTIFRQSTWISSSFLCLSLYSITF